MQSQYQDADADTVFAVAFSMSRAVVEDRVVLVRTSGGHNRNKQVQVDRAVEKFSRVFDHARNKSMKNLLLALDEVQRAFGSEGHRNFIFQGECGGVHVDSEQFAHELLSVLRRGQQLLKIEQNTRRNFEVAAAPPSASERDADRNRAGVEL